MNTTNTNIDKILLSFLAQKGTLFTEQTGVLPSELSLSTADSLILAVDAAVNQDPEKHPTFKAVCAPTGGGKTVMSRALLVHALRTDPDFTAALVVETLESVEENLQAFRKVLGRSAEASADASAEASADEDCGEDPIPWIAAGSQIHKEPPNQAEAAKQFREKGVVASETFPPPVFKAARLVITTHDAWRRDMASKAQDRGVLKVKTPSGWQDRSLIVIDEDPKFQKIHTRQPKDVAALGDILSGSALKTEAESSDFINHHHAIPALREIQHKMELIKDINRVGGKLLESGASLEFTDEEREAVWAITKDELLKKLRGLPGAYERLDAAWGAVEFLKAAIDGRLFFSRLGESTFYAYDMALPGQHRTVILDGTADLNILYSLGGNTAVSTAMRPDYSQVTIKHVIPPREFKGQMRRSGVLSSDIQVESYLHWFRTVLVDNTEPGDKILAYAKKDLVLRTRVLEDLGTPVFEPGTTPGMTVPDHYIIDGRQVHFVNFGRGRGSNAWQECSVYMQLGDFHLPKAVHVADTGSVTGRVFSQADLDNLSTGTTRDPMYLAARNAHLLISTKQNAARIRIRSFEPGTRKALPAKLIFLDTDYELLKSRLQEVFPGAAGIERVVDQEVRETMTGPQKLALLLEETEEVVLTASDVQEATGINPNHVLSTLRSPSVKTIVDVGGWRKATKKEVGLPGKGWVLTRLAP